MVNALGHLDRLTVNYKYSAPSTNVHFVGVIKLIRLKLILGRLKVDPR
jgi:hypothetical protein